MEDSKETLSKSEVFPKDVDPKIKDMLGAGLHFGHRKTRQNPKMKPYIFGVRNSVSIIDLEQTQVKLKEALDFLKKSVKDGKTILFVDTRPQTRRETQALAETLKMPYVTERWSGGTITNWRTISLRIEYLKDLEGKMKSEEWEKYTKKERHLMEGEAKKLNILWGGIKSMTNLPDIVFIVDMHADSLAAREAKKRNILVVAISDTNVNPELADYPIPANDDALSSVKYILGAVKDAIMEKGEDKKQK